MRAFETLTFVTLFLDLAARFFSVEKRPSWTNYFPLTAILFILIHLFTEGYRWQMVPAYVLAILLLVLSVPLLLGKMKAPPAGKDRRILNGIGAALGLVIIVIATALSALLPVFKMPNPTGQYAVGTMSFAFTDESRPEIYTPDPADKRLVYVQAWYPTGSTTDSARAPMWIFPKKVTPVVLKSLLGMPGFLFDHLALVKSNSYLNTPLKELESAYPVLVFSHGHAEGFVAQNMVQMEELASHGYVIFSIGHTYESSLVLDAQGQAIPMSKTQVDVFNQECLETNGAYRKIFSTTGTEQIQAARAWMAASPVAQQSMQIWTQDMQFALTQIEQMNNGQVDSPFAGHLDTAHIGVFGMSFGGATAFQLCAVDSRCHAAINMDGTQWGNLLDNPLQTPFMMMSGEYTNGINDWALNSAPENGYNVWVRETTHENFTDFNLVSPIFQKMDVLGQIDSQQMERIMNAYILAFFDQTLKGIPSPLLQGNNPKYPEVEFSIIDGTSK